MQVRAGGGIRLQSSRTFACAHFCLSCPPARPQLLWLPNRLPLPFELAGATLRNGAEEAWSRVSFLQFLPCHGNRLLPWANCSARCVQKRTEVSQCLLLSDHVPNEDHFPELLVKLAFANWLASEITAWGRRRRRESVEVFFSFKICSQSKAW